MNILFYDKDFGPGGIAVVSETLATALRQRGYNTAIYVLSLPYNALVSRLPKNVPLIVGQGIKYNKGNVEQLRKILVERKIDIVVNQQGLNPIPIRILDKARKGLNVKIISVYHMQVNTNGRIISVQQEIERCRHRYMLPLLHLKMKLFKWITAKSMRNVYNKSDIYEVLSPSFVPLFSEFTGINNPTKLKVQTNPVTIQLPQKEIDLNSKEKIILYVGRLEPEIKKPQRIMDMWKLLHKQFPEWHLVIVGDGPEKKRLDEEIETENITNVKLVGFQNPQPYYEKASILLLTSETEGFPLVLAEAMSYGVVPCVYDSFPASSDIVKDGQNGILIPKDNETFNVHKSVELVSTIMNDSNKLNNLAKNAIIIARSYSIERISKDWEATFKHFIGGGVENTSQLKDYQIIFVGRLENMTKRPYRILQTWKLIEGKYPDWNLTFVGDGPDRQSLEAKVEEEGLERVSFVGFQNPVEYYKRASILMLTSDIEGFPLVLAECMSFGVVSVVYASYPAVYDIIEDGIDGIIIPKKDEFPAELAARKISAIMVDENKRLKMALAATKKSQQFSISTICRQWEDTFKEIINH